MSIVCQFCAPKPRLGSKVRINGWELEIQLWESNSLLGTQTWEPKSEVGSQHCEPKWTLVRSRDSILGSHACSSCMHAVHNHAVHNHACSSLLGNQIWRPKSEEVITSWARFSDLYKLEYWSQRQGHNFGYTKVSTRDSNLSIPKLGLYGLKFECSNED